MPVHTTPSPPAVVLGTASFGTGTPQAKFNSEETTRPLLQLLQSRGITALDTARAYPVGNPGSAELVLGTLGVGEWASISTKVTSWQPGAHSAASIASSVPISLAALRVEAVDIMYLHSPDRGTSWEETCAAMHEQWKLGRFKRFGLSNYTAAEVHEICVVCERRGWVRPSVYQGRYNAIIRSGEEELFPILRKWGIAFFAYSPSAVGMFSGKIDAKSVDVGGSRWDKTTRLGQAYEQVYLKPELIDAAARIADKAQAAHIGGHAVALRWVVYHSILNGEHGDSVIIGCSTVKQLEDNLDAIKDGPLSHDLAEAMDEVWNVVKDHAAPYHL
ncbi:Aldo/keto reductase [Dothidotthia symphoricarpi CBS 119687]|uniref:Aldo/keto reductase n=1 Tax=Dothidotthia symphoricarpi CBS 119687 TaxID=1392245 RepID=A0A6A6AMU3_9PLEO|nr:Aldo/keto reductase [Dothidotthia symphoricarpi CBS 119687]KAF2132458.1 Aldo/keto reductase [Dothidotthia symphoricarpi CBS 119687]